MADGAATPPSPPSPPPRGSRRSLVPPAEPVALPPAVSEGHAPVAAAARTAAPDAGDGEPSLGTLHGLIQQLSADQSAAMSALQQQVAALATHVRDLSQTITAARPDAAGAATDEPVVHRLESRGVITEVR